MYATNYFETSILGAYTGATYTAPSTVYIGLFISSPGESGGGTEITYSGYQRQSVNFSAPAAVLGINMAIQNSADINFPTAPTAAGTITYIGIFDSVTGGNMLLYGQLTEPLSIQAGEAPVLLASQIIYTLTGNSSPAYKTKILNTLRGISLQGITPYLALYNSDPTAGGAELSGASYARVALTFSSPSQTESGQAVITNSADVSFPRPNEAWGVWSFTIIADAASGGNIVSYAQKLPSREIKKGFMPKALAGNITVAIN
jgi:hypothetical protein